MNIIALNDNGSCVIKTKKGYDVLLPTITHSVTDSVYSDESLALARLEYFKPKSHVEVMRLADNIERSNRS